MENLKNLETRLAPQIQHRCRVDRSVRPPKLSDDLYNFDGMPVNLDGAKAVRINGRWFVPLSCGPIEFDTLSHDRLNQLWDDCAPQPRVVRIRFLKDAEFSAGAEPLQFKQGAECDIVAPLAAQLIANGLAEQIPVT